MAGFYYFFPSATPEDVVDNGHINYDWLKRYPDLVPVFADGDEIGQQVILQRLGVGPGRIHGILLYHRPVSETIVKARMFKPQSQEWTEFLDFWVGYEVAEKPTSVDLVRPDPKSSVIMTDATGSPWLLPIIKATDEANGSLPVNLQRDIYGELCRRPLLRYAHITAIAEQIHDDIHNPDGMQKDEGWYRDRALEILQLNHRICNATLNILDSNEILSSENSANICLVAIDNDLPSIIKKNHAASEPLNGSLGSVESCQDTNQPLVTSTASR